MSKKSLEPPPAGAATSIEQRLAIEHGATHALATSASLAEATPKIIATVCETLGWQCGSGWHLLPQEDVLHCVGGWGVPDPQVGEFLELTRTILQARRPGGLIRRAWLEGEPVWARDVATDQTFQRAEAALKAGLHSALAFPIKYGEATIGAMEFFSHEILQPDAALLDCMRYVGSHIGQFCERTEMQARLRASEESFHDTIELAAIGIAHIAPSGHFVHANRWLCELLGYSRDELLERSVKDVSHPEDRNLSDELRPKLRAGLINMFRLEKRYLRKDQTPVWLSVATAMRRSPSGEALYEITAFEDISARKQAETALRESEARFRSLTELSSDGYWEQDADLRFTRFESRNIAQDDREALLGKKPWEAGLGTRAEDGMVAHAAVLRARQPFRDFEYSYLNRGGERRWVSVNGQPVFDEAGGFAGYRGTALEITGRKQAEDRIQYLATHDSLTGLPNRSMFSQLLALAIDTSQRYERKFAVLFMDLDRFKVINDTLGHSAGDELLQTIARRLKKTLRASDVVARLGGDEFVVLVQETKNTRQVMSVARKILSAVIKPLTVGGQECRVTASIGVSMYPADATDEGTLMKHADTAMYLAKEEGKNNYQIYSKDIKPQSVEKMALETNLRRALEANELSLQYQAKQDLRSGAITGVEALLRWNSAKLGAITPAQFIPLAEETGLIVPIGRWVLKTACAQHMAWKTQGLPAVPMAVNLSPRQFLDPDLLPDIKAVLRDSGMAAAMLELEITESMVMQNPERAIRLLIAIKQLGVRLAIDDFGTGYSSLAQLKRFPIDTLKVDRSFIRDIPRDAEDKAITEAIIAMGRTLSLTVIAEGVETEEQKTFLREHACDQMQGFYFSKPVAPELFADLLRRHTGTEAS